MSLILFSFPVIEKILDTLHSNADGINRTRLACMCGLNYGTCIRYIDFLARLEWVSNVSGRGSLVALNNKGREYAHILSQSEDRVDSETWVSRMAFDGIDDISHDGDMVLRSEKDRASRSGEIERKSSSQKIMIIDDEKDILLTYKVFFAEHGFDVLAFFDPKAAIRAFRKEPQQFDLVILDIRMASINGLQVYRKLKSIRPAVKVIFVTGLDAAPEITSLLPGVRKQDILAKPVDLDRLAETAHTVILGENRS